jgi:hypothetical protein
MLNNTNNTKTILINNTSNNSTNNEEENRLIINADFFKLHNFYINKIVVENDLYIEVVFNNKLTTQIRLFELHKNLYKNTTVLKRNGVEYDGEEKQLFITKIKSSINKLFKF